MKGITGWNYAPYTLLNASQTEKTFFICQLQPFAGGFSLAFRDAAAGGHTLLYRRRGETAWQELPLSGLRGRAEGLRDQTDYETCVRRDADGAVTAARLVRTGEALGTVVNYLHPEDDTYAFSGHYLCSPSLLALPGGKMLAAMDVYGPKQAQNLTLIFESSDGGATWEYVTELYPCFWGKLFWHRGKVYMLAMACEYGDLLIGVSEDEGHTWSPPVRLFNGANAQERGPHKAPMPVISHAGRLYTGIDYGAWKYGGHDNCILSIREEDDLLRPENWHLTAPLPFDKAWPGLPQGPLKGCLEGNAVAGPDGAVYNMLRLQQNTAQPNGGQAVLLKYEDADRPLAFESAVDFPLGANSKFVVLKEGKWYIAVGNEYFSAETPTARTVLSVAVSSDLKSWWIVSRVADMRKADSGAVAFQYPDAQMVGRDLLILSRTAMNGANSYHNSNMITFHAIKDFYGALCGAEE